MVNKTKLKIIKAAIKQYNANGLLHVLNQDIANEAGIGLSSFNYHFKTKSDLLFEVCLFLKVELRERIAKVRVLMMKAKGLTLYHIFLEFVIDFRFFYLDTHNILKAHPGMEEEMQKQVAVSLQLIKNLNYLFIGMGHMHPEPLDQPELYDDVALQIWMQTYFWLPQAKIRGVKELKVSEGMKELYFIFLPYLTDKGKLLFEQYIANIKDTSVLLK